MSVSDSRLNDGMAQDWVMTAAAGDGRRTHLDQPRLDRGGLSPGPRRRHCLPPCPWRTTDM